MLCLPSIISLCLLLDLDNLSSLQRVLFRTGWGGDDCVGVNCGDQDNDIRDNGDYLQTQTGGDQEPDRYRIQEKASFGKEDRTLSKRIFVLFCTDQVHCITFASDKIIRL